MCGNTLSTLRSTRCAKILPDPSSIRQDPNEATCNQHSPPADTLQLQHEAAVHRSLGGDFSLQRKPMLLPSNVRFVFGGRLVQLEAPVSREIRHACSQ